MKATELSIIIVNYNTKVLLKNCLDSIISHTKNVNYEIIVVDNASTDGSLDMIKELYPQIALQCNKENVGFSRANNLGYRMSSGDYLLFLNSDTLVRNDAILTMMTYIKDNPDIGIVGPKVVGPENHPSRSYMRFLDVKSLFLGTKYLSWFIDTEKYRLHYDHYDYSSTQSVPWLSGACLMTSRHVFQEAGCFDEHYFLYLEDMDLCMQVKKNGYSNVYLPSAEIVHLFGGSSEPKKSELKKIYLISANHYFRKNFSTIEYWLAKLYFETFEKHSFLSFRT
jgi:GT2 family glycosyltransferase